MVLAFALVSTSFFSLGVQGASSPSFEKVVNSQNIALLEAVVIDPAHYRGGGGITIIEDSALLPDSGLGVGGSDTSESAAENDQISVYVVRADDSLSQIAEMYGVTANTILWANDLGRGGVIHEGQVLVILPVAGVKHKVVKGDTLQSITKKYGADLEEVLTFNNLEEGSSLALGQEIIVPHGEITTPAPSRSSGSVANRGSGPSLAGYFRRPIDGGVRTQGLHGYNAVDLASYAGAPIYAAAGGKVIINKVGGWNGGFGNFVVIEHPNGTQTLYAHNQSNAVVRGQTVEKGQVVGYMGATGKVTGVHLHFEIRGAKNPF